MLIIHDWQSIFGFAYRLVILDNEDADLEIQIQDQIDGAWVPSIMNYQTDGDGGRPIVIPDHAGALEGL